MNLNLKSEIINVQLMHFKNDDTGEITDMTAILYKVPKEDTNESLGSGTMTFYKQGDCVSKFKGKVEKPVNLTIEQRPLKNSIKYVIKKVDEVTI